MNISRIASAAFNSIVSGLAGFTATINIPLKQLEDEVCETKLNVIYKYYLRNQLPKQDLYQSLNCVKVDCAPIDKCCGSESFSGKIAHFEIPQLATCCGEDAIAFIGTINKEIKFKVYYGNSFKFHKYKLRRKNVPYVYIDTTINSRGLMDCYLFNAPLLERVSVTAIFRDDRLFDKESCCDMSSDNDMTSIDMEVKDIIVKKYILYFRQLYPQPQPNDQIPK